jgi:colicin import membrane protein
MSEWAVARRAGAAFLFSLSIGSTTAMATDAASAIAERFAAETDRTQARQEPAQPARNAKSKPTAARKQHAKPKTDDEKRRAAAQAAENARRLAEQRNAEEAEMLERARREAQEMREREEQARLVEEARRLIIEAEKERNNAEALLARERQQAAQQRARIAPPPSDTDARQREAAESATRRAALEAAERERAKAEEEEKLAQLRRDETRRLIEKLNRMRQIREARIAAQERQRRALAEQSAHEAPPYTVRTVPPARTETESAEGGAPPSRVTPDSAPSPLPGEPRMALGGRSRADDGFPETGRDDERHGQVTVLLIMAPGHYGIRRHGPKVADPILCKPDGCYVSEGADRPARFLPGRKALGFGNTFGQRAGACRQHLGCVFRGIELRRLPAYLQPVDLHILKHDRRRPHEVAGDSDCRTGSGHLVCERGIYAEDYAMWIVPERIADAVGPVVLEEAVQEGLKGPRSADIFSLLGR